MKYLPKVRGQIKKSFPLSTISWLKVGGPADILFKPVDLLDLQKFMCRIDKKVPIFVSLSSLNKKKKPFNSEPSFIVLNLYILKGLSLSPVLKPL